MRRWLTFVMTAVVMLATAPIEIRAETLACPSLNTAEQVGTCPSLRELRIMFRSTCGAAGNPNAPKPGMCDSFEDFQSHKNTVMWEAGDAGFMGYLPCTLPTEKIRTAQATELNLASSRRITKTACGYQGDLTLTLRRRGACALPSGASKGRLDCAGDPAACMVECE